MTFGPLTEVLNLNNPPANDRHVLVLVYKDKCCLKLKYKIPDFWPSKVPTFNFPVPPLQFFIGSCMRMPGDIGVPTVFPYSLYALFRNKILETSHVLNNAVLLMGDTVYINGYNYDTESGIVARYRQLQKLPELKGAWSTGASYSSIPDDHEVSINNGSFGAPSIGLCVDVFSKMWPNNPFRVKNLSKITFAFVRFDIGIIGLDCRSYRTNPEAPNSHNFGGGTISMAPSSFVFNG